MNKDSKALFTALQKRKGSKDIKPLVTKDTAKTPDIYYGMKPLFWALSYGASADVLQLLLEACPEAAGEKHPVGGWTPLHYAEKLGAEAVKLLIQKCPGAAKEKDTEGELPLHWAAEHNAPAAVIKQLLEAYKEAAAEEDKLGRLPIKLAMDNNASDDIVNMLSEANPKASAAALAPTEVQEEALPVALLFPGQGSQYVGMLEEAKDIPAVAAMLKEANEILGYDLLNVCLEGPEEKLQDTVYCQPAMYVAGLAAVEKLRLENPEAVRRPQALAGLSLGEYTALTAAGVFSFADGLKLVKERAEAMQEAANTKPQAMLSVAGLDEKKVTKLCEQAIKKAGAGSVCQVSNYLFQKGYTIGGTKAAVEECQQLAEKAKALQARLIKASGGFHTSLMEPAKVRLEKTLQEMLPRMKRPRCKVFMNVTAQPVDMYTDAQTICDLLARQLTSAVQWKGCVEAIIADGVTEYHECGPMKQLKAMMKRIDNGAWGKTQNVEV
mmetsp:Transcript_8159/g.22982  ORF Transcript_8159/g.22982 Transcript_8159/m.22982 type:complete len:495 (-) Transcript_8159:97-1581(-)